MNCNDNNTDEEYKRKNYHYFGKTLEYYGITNNSRLFLTVKLMGGGGLSTALSYTDVFQAKLIKVKVSQNENTHLTVIPGLNLECKCKNKK